MVKGVGGYQGVVGRVLEGVEVLDVEALDHVP